MAATAGYTTEVYITATDTNPSASNLLGGTQSAAYNPSMAELDTSTISSAFTDYILGQETTEVSVTLVYDPSNTAQAALETAFNARSSVWVHVALTGTTACKKVECKVPSLSYNLDRGDKVPLEVTLKSVGARSTSTVS
jgi:hypothetical protein